MIGKVITCGEIEGEVLDKIRSEEDVYLIRDRKGVISYVSCMSIEKVEEFDNVKGRWKRLAQDDRYNSLTLDSIKEYERHLATVILKRLLERGKYSLRGQLSDVLSDLLFRKLKLSCVSVSAVYTQDVKVQEGYYELSITTETDLEEIKKLLKQTT